MRFWHELMDDPEAPACDNCELPVDTTDPDHKLPCGCMLCSICLGRGRGEPDEHPRICKSAATSAAASGPAMTLGRLQEIMLRFTDRTPATPRGIRGHPDYVTLLLRTLRAAGVIRDRQGAMLEGISIIHDAEVPFGRLEYVYEEDLHALR